MRVIFDVFKAALGTIVWVYGMYLFILEDAPDILTVLMILGGFAYMLISLLDAEDDYQDICKIRKQNLRKYYFNKHTSR